MLDEFFLILGVEVSREGFGPHRFNNWLASDRSVSQLERLIVFLVRSLELKLLRLIVVQSTEMRVPALT